MTNIRNQSIGNEYSVGQMNRNTLRSANVQVNVAGVDVVGSAGGVFGSTSSISNAQPRRPAASFNSFGGGLTSGNKPFASRSSSPTISPYMNLFRDDITGDSDNYNTLVRPQLQQQQVNRSMQVQTQAIDRHVQSLAAKPAFNPQGSASQSPTGHPTGFMYHSHYYPALGKPRGR
jgi:hypothetical protein